MGDTTEIAWCDSTFNPWRGCTKVSAGCANCYADTMSKRNPSVLGVWGPNGKRVVAAESYWKQPLKWNREAEEAGERHRVFCASLADVFEDWDGLIVDSKGEELRTDHDGTSACDASYMSLSELCRRRDSDPDRYPIWHRRANMDHLRLSLFRLADRTPHLDWLLLTKRPERILECWPENGGPWLKCEKCGKVEQINNWDVLGADVASNLFCTDCHTEQVPQEVHGCDFRPNVWLGTSVENQASLKRIDELRRCRDLAPVLFLSCEPLLEDLGEIDLTGIDWVIAGGESGPQARPSHPECFRSLRDQCQAAGVPFFFKQWGEYCPSDASDARGGNVTTNGYFCADGRYISRSECPDASVFIKRVGKKKAGRELDGRQWNQFPGVLA